MLASLRSRLLLAFIAPAVALFVAAGVAGYAVSRAALEDELGRSLSAIAAAAASQLSADRVLSLEPGDDAPGTRTFHNTARTLDEVRAATGVARLVVFDRDGHVRVDSSGRLPIGAPLPELARDRLELNRVFAGQRVASLVLFSGTDGHLYKTGYAPLARGEEVVGAVAVEGSAAFFVPLAQLSRGYGLLAALALAVLALVALVTASGLSRPLRRLVDAALRIGRGDLSTPVAPERAAEIGVLSRELEAMRSALESRDRQLKMMLAGVAHEVRNPMGGIELFAGLTADELSTAAPNVAEARSHVERIRSEIGQLQRIVEEFLAFAREEKLSRAPVEVGRLLRTVADLFETDAKRKGVTLQLEAAEGTVDGDESLLLSALGNGVKNALQASPSGSTVVLRSGPTGRDQTIEIQDTGGGIAPELAEKIFEPFFTTRAQGTGLGLALARKIARAHAGELTLESRNGQTTFRLRLPRSS